MLFTTWLRLWNSVGAGHRWWRTAARRAEFLRRRPAWAAEWLEPRCLLAAPQTFELASLLPDDGGDGSMG